MKKLILLLTVVAFASCKKTTYTCSCYKGSTNEQVYTTSAKGDNNTVIQSTCAEKEAVLIQTYGAVRCEVTSDN